MKELNELVEHAKEIAVLHGPVWSSALCESGCDGRAIKHHALISDSKNDFVIDTCSDTNEASWPCDYLELCSPANILAIAEAFRALEQESQKNLDGALAWQQRAEAAEAALAEEKRINSKLREDRAGLARECNAFEAKLKELEKQKPVGTVSISMDWNTHRNIATVNMRPDLVVAEMKNGDELFARPAPAVSLAELVPGEKSTDVDYAYYPLTKARHEGWNACRAAILRNIEEKSK